MSNLCNSGFSNVEQEPLWAYPCRTWASLVLLMFEHDSFWIYQFWTWVMLALPISSLSGFEDCQCLASSVLLDSYQCRALIILELPMSTMIHFWMYHCRTWITLDLQVPCRWLHRSLDCSIARSIARSLDRSIARSPDRLTCLIPCRLTILLLINLGCKCFHVFLCVSEFEIIKAFARATHEPSTRVCYTRLLSGETTSRRDRWFWVSTQGYCLVVFGSRKSWRV